VVEEIPPIPEWFAPIFKGSMPLIMSWFFDWLLLTLDGIYMVETPSIISIPDGCYC
jgi:hypothetical protein